MCPFGKLAVLCGAVTIATGSVSQAQGRMKKPPAPPNANAAKPPARSGPPPEPPALKDAKRLFVAAAHGTLALPKLSDRCEMLTTIAQMQDNAGDRPAQIETLHLLGTETQKNPDSAEKAQQLLALAVSLEACGQGKEAKGVLRDASEAAAQVVDKPPLAAPPVPDKNAAPADKALQDAVNNAKAGIAQAANAAGKAMREAGEDAPPVPPERDELLRQIARQQALWYCFADAHSTAARIKKDEPRVSALRSIGWVQALCRDKAGILKTAALTGNPCDKPRSLALVALAQSEKKQIAAAEATFREGMQSALALTTPEQRSAALPMMLSTLGAMADVKLLLEILDTLPDPALQDTARTQAVRALWEKADSKDYAAAAAQCQTVAEKITDPKLRSQSAVLIIILFVQAGDEKGAKTLAMQTIGQERAAPIFALVAALNKVKDPDVKKEGREMLLSLAVPANPEERTMLYYFRSLVVQLMQEKQSQDALDVSASGPDFLTRLQCYAAIAQTAAQTKDKAAIAAVLTRLEAMPQDKLSEQELGWLTSVLAYLYGLQGDRQRVMQFIEKMPRVEDRLTMLLLYGTYNEEVNAKTKREMFEKAVALLPQITDTAKRIQILSGLINRLDTDTQAAEIKTLMALFVPLVLAIKDEDEKGRYMTTIYMQQAQRKDLPAALETIALIKDATQHEQALTWIANEFASTNDMTTLEQIMQMLKTDESRSTLLRSLATPREDEADPERIAKLLTLATLPEDRADLLLTLGNAQVQSGDRLAARKTLREAQAAVAAIKDPSQQDTEQVQMAMLLSGLDKKDEAKALLRQVSETEARIISEDAARPEADRKHTAPAYSDEEGDGGPTDSLLDLAEKQSDLGDREGAMLSLRHIPDAAQRWRSMQQFASYRVAQSPDDHDFAWAERDTTPEERPYILLGIAASVLRQVQNRDE